MSNLTVTPDVGARLPSSRFDDSGRLRVAVVIPVLNEAHYIRACVASLLPQVRAMGAEIIVVDGGSSDGTLAILGEISADHNCVSVLHNAKRLQAAAVNLAAREAAPDIDTLVRADAHALYPPNFLRLCVEALRTRDATSVVVPMRTVGSNGMQRAIAAVQNSRFGNGGSAHRVGGQSGFVEHGHHAAFDRDFFLNIGGYDEGFSHNEDAEHDVRAHSAGGRVWMCRDAMIDYVPRSALWPLAKQYFRHGRGRMQTLLRHGLRPRPRQMAAPMIMLGSVFGILLLPVSPLFGLIPLSYIVACLVWAIIASARARDLELLGMAPAVVTVHLSWAAGFLSRLVVRPDNASARSMVAAMAPFTARP